MAAFDWFPFLEGKYITYQNWFALIGSVAALTISLICFLISLILFEFSKNKRQYFQKESSPILSQVQMTNNAESLRNSLAFNSNANNSNNLSRQNNNNNNPGVDSLYDDDSNNGKPQSYTSACCDTRGKTVVKKLSRFFRTAGFFFLTLIPIFCGAMNVIHTYVSIAIVFSIMSVMIILNDVSKNAGLQKNKNNRQQSRLQSYRQTWSKKDLKKRKYGALVYAFVLPMFFHNTCLSFYNNSIGYFNPTLGFVVNTQITRYFQLPQACPPGPPCHVYATVPEDTATSVFLNIHTNKGISSGVYVQYDQVTYWNASQSTRLKTLANSYNLDYIDEHGARNVHTALLLNLFPETQYIFRVFYDNKVQSEHFYKTLPGRNSTTPITMINSGDSGHTSVVAKLNNGLVKQRPDIWFIGGDLAYDDNIDACYYTWDMYLSDIERIFQEIGYIFPIVLGVGNHDVGLNELPGINVTVSYNGPQFHTYFPQHFVRDPNTFAIVKAIPDVRDRSTSFYQEIGSAVYMSLDSGYMQTYDGWQRDYLERVLKSHAGWLQFVNYHVPIFSICGHFDHDKTPIVHALQYWVPLFDQYRVAGSFENHVHAFKRTFPLFGNNVVENGTVYFGDGAYGAIPSTSCQLDSRTDIFAAMGKFNNYWVSQITPGQNVEHWAFDSDGDVADHYVQSVQYYVAN